MVIALHTLFSEAQLLLFGIKTLLPWDSNVNEKPANMEGMMMPGLTLKAGSSPPWSWGTSDRDRSCFVQNDQQPVGMCKEFSNLERWSESSQNYRGCSLDLIF